MQFFNPLIKEESEEVKNLVLVSEKTRTRDHKEKNNLLIFKNNINDPEKQDKGSEIKESINHSRIKIRGVRGSLRE